MKGEIIMMIGSVNSYNQGPKKPGDPQPHLNGGTGGPQKPGDPQPHLNQSSSDTSTSSTNGTSNNGQSQDPMEKMILGLMRAFGIQPTGDKDGDMQKLKEAMNGNSDSSSTGSTLSTLA